MTQPVVSGPTQQLIDLCNAIARGERQREAELQALRQSRHEGLSAAWEAFAQSVEEQGEEFADAHRVEVEQVEAQFLAYSQCLDQIGSYFTTRKPDALTAAAGRLAATSPALLAAQGAWEAAILTTGPSRFPIVNLFDNMGKGVRDGRLPIERWIVACESHHDFYRNVVAEIDASKSAGEAGVPQRRAACVALMSLLEEMGQVTAACSKADFDAFIERMIGLQTDLEEAIATFNYNALSATPTASAEANRVIHAAFAVRDGLVAPDVLHGLADKMRQTVRVSIADAGTASRMTAESAIVAEQIPIVTASLQDIDQALALLGQVSGAGKDLDDAVGRLEDGVGRLDAANRLISQHNENFGRVICIHCQHFNPADARTCESCQRVLPRFEQFEASRGFVEGGEAAGARESVVTVTMKELEDACHGYEQGVVSRQALLELIAVNLQKVYNVQSRTRDLGLPDVPEEANEWERETSQAFIDLGEEGLALLAQGLQACKAGLQQMQQFAQSRQLSDMHEGLRQYSDGVQKLSQIERVADAFVAALPRALDEGDATDFAAPSSGD